MVDYQVGNLQIVFNAVDETSKSFDNLAKNLNAVKKAISNIGSLGTSDLNKFGDSLDKIREKFSPLLADINGASAGITAFNEVTKRLGINKVSQVAEAFNQLNTEAEETSTKVGDLKSLISETEGNLAPMVSKTIKSFSDLNLELLAQQQYLKQLNRAYAVAFSKNNVSDIEAYGKKIVETKQAIQGLKDQIKNFGKELPEVAVAVEEVLTPFNDAQKEVSKLTNELLNLTYASGQVDSGIANSIRELNTQINTTQEAVKKATMSEEELTIYEYRNIEATRKQRIEFLEAALALGRAGENAELYRQELAELTNEQKKNDNATKKSTKSFGKLFQSLKRIALYRILRTVLKEISQAFTETVKAFAEVDDSVNSTMSNITSSLNVIKLSFGSVILPLLQIVEPIIKQISIAFANLANIVLQAMSDGETFTAVNANYWEDYRKQLEKTKGSLLDFDKIRALNTNKAGSLSDALLPDQPVDKTNERVQQLRETFEKLRIVFSKVFDILKRVGEPVFNVFITLLDTAITVLTPVINAIADFVRELDSMGLLEPIIWGITAALLAMGAVKVVNGITNVISAISNLNLTTLGLYATIGILAGAIAYFVSNLDDIGAAAKWIIPIVSLAAGAFAAWAVAKSAAAAGIAAPAQALITAGALTAAISMVAGTAIAKQINASSNFSGSHGGGGFRSRGETSTFTAPTAGSEMNYSLSSAQQTTASNTSMESAMYNALVRYGSQNRGTTTENINLVVDGRTLVTTTRQAANKMGLDFAQK